MIFHVVAAAAGRPEPIRREPGGSASIRFLVAREEGTLAEVGGVAEARARPGVVEVGVTALLGQPVVPRHSFRDRLGYVIAVAPGHAEAARTADAALTLLTARINPATAAHPA
jgi:biotin carboxylase